jgi:D-alanyl-lipoteichoic acid acyltransferase DltB (MBOAT superfamily)
MLFNSFEFICLFLPITLWIFFAIGGRGWERGANAWLMMASLFFYGWWKPAYLVLLGFSLVFNYTVGAVLSQRFQVPVSRKLMLMLGLCVNLSLISYYKYANFFAININAVAGTNFNLNNVILPLGISFFTFEQIAFLVDVYRGTTKEHSFIKYCLFVTFFPRLIAGPIILHQEIIPQFNKNETYQFDAENLAVGLTIFITGLFKKVILADGIAVYATPVFEAAARGQGLTFLEGWSGAIAYLFQLYFDFSGYSEMAIGAARMFGIKLPLNFNSPYKSANIIEFWRHWHMTLSRFLREYLYIPLGGNRKGELRHHANLMITMLLGGLWHGAGWTFVFWGGLHGIYLVINHQWHAFRRSLGHDLKKITWWGSLLGCLITFLAVLVSWVFFRAENLKAAFAILASMSGANGLSLSSTLPTNIKMLVLLALGVWLLPNTQQWLVHYDPAFDKVTADTPSVWGERLWTKLQWRPALFQSLLLSLMAFFALLKMFSVTHSEFLYFNF